MDMRLDFYKTWALFRESVGGPMDPLFFGTDAKALSKVDPAQVSILELKSKLGAKGVKQNALDEWRTSSGKALTLVREIK